MTLLRIKALKELTGLSAPTLRLYADCGLIPSQLDSGGARLFPPEAADAAKKVYAQRMARFKTGRRRTTLE